MQVDIIIPGHPVPAQRMTQKSKWSKRAQRSLGYQKQIAWEWKAVAGHIKLEGPLKLTCWFYFRSKIHGDLSNLIKAVEDGLQYGRAFNNDKQIIRYGESGIKYDDDERAEIIIEEMDPYTNS
jgi:crossover junction endodeoxyribonuclease RusA